MKKRKIIATGVLGNALEFYDFTLYGVFAVIIAQLYFPSQDAMSAILKSWGAFAAGFVMRPFGAFIFGSIGDRFGRKKALTLSILGMGVPTLVIGLLPTFDQIGIWAPILLIACRLIQGTSTGGEYNGAAIFALEHTGKAYPGFYGGLITGSCVIGALFATGMGTIVTQSPDPTFYWRGAFIFGGMISFVGFYIRRKISESPEFLELQQKKQVKQEGGHSQDEDGGSSSKHKAQKGMGLIDVLKHYRKPYGVSLLIGALNGALSYTLFGFLNTYLKSYVGVSLENALFYNFVGLGTFMVFSPLFGRLMDRVGQMHYFQTAPFIVLCLGLVSFQIITFGRMQDILLAQVLLGLATAAIAGPQHGFVQTLFPVKARYLGISSSFCLGMALCGGTAPLLLTYLIDRTGNLYIPGYFIAVLSACLGGFVFFLRKHVKSNGIYKGFEKQTFVRHNKTA